MHKNCFLLFLLFWGNISFGQNLPKMQVWQDSLLSLGQKIFDNRAEVERIESNFLFVKTLVSALKEPNSYFFDFDKLKMISAIRSPDDKFRVFSWNVPLHDGSYLYYGAIQHKSGTLKLIPLLDKTFEIKDVNRAVVRSDTWYGAQYYQIIPFKPNSYLLLGWKGHHMDYTYKLIEVLNFSPTGEVMFGAPVFSDDSSLMRKVFSYARQATMLLQYDPQNQRIEFDHLIPLQGGKPHQMVPDLTHDAYQITPTQLIYKEDVVILNPEN